MVDWDYRGSYGVIRFADGREAFLQGEEAAELDEQIEACETDQQIEMILDAYDGVAE